MGNLFVTALEQADALAIQLFIADGNPEEDWPYVDEAVRLHYRLATQKNSCVVEVSPEPGARRSQPATSAKSA